MRSKRPSFRLVSSDGRRLLLTENRLVDAGSCVLYQLYGIDILTRWQFVLYKAYRIEYRIEI